MIFSGGGDSRIRVWKPDQELDTGLRVVDTLMGHSSCVRCIACENGNLISSGDDKKIKRWQVEGIHQPCGVLINPVELDTL